MSKSPDTLQFMSELLSRLGNAASTQTRATEKLLVSRPAPDFEMDSTKDLETLKEKVRLSDYSGRWLVLMFYPLDFTFVCPTELTTFSDRYQDFQQIGADILGISIDSVYSHRAWLQTPRSKNGVEGLRFPLAADITKQVSRDYEVLLEDKGIALRGLFIIDPEGVLRYKVVQDLNIGRSAEEVLRIIRALQTGSLCPAEWRPGQKTLKG
ncbi:MAG TPA: peroxiredoxin [Pyrinomonadaceae bacterium]|jgi:peroxiredoxin (alkyl hydroperoxide reductase subunit C)